jgi:FKBP-type peptidyl-prolyl cis-trans isomerase
MRKSVTMMALLVSALTMAAACSSKPAASENASTPSIPAPPDVGAPPADAVRSPTGLASRVLVPGTGTQHPRPNSQVVVHYTGWTTDGKMFDSSVAKGEPASFRLDGVIKGWTEGVQMMVVGEKRRFWIPPGLAYEGLDGPQGLLVFDIELIKIES